MSDRTIIVPNQYMGGIDATLRVESPDGESATMALDVLGVIVAESSGHRVAEWGRWTWFDMPEAELVAHFAAFFGAACEGEGPREDWEVWADGADEWADALYMLGEGL